MSDYLVQFNTLETFNRFAAKLPVGMEVKNVFVVTPTKGPLAVVATEDVAALMQVEKDKTGWVASEDFRVKLGL